MIKNFIKYDLLILLIFIGQYSYANNLYLTFKSQYKQFEINNKINTEYKCLELINETDSNLFNKLNTEDLNNKNLDFEIRIANINNCEGKRYKYYSNGVSKKCSNPIWGIFWNYIDERNYSSLEFKGDNSCLYDFSDERTLIITINKINMGNKTVVDTFVIRKGLNLYDGYNSVKICAANGKIRIFAGEKHLMHIVSLDSDLYGNIGYITGPAAHTLVRRASANFKESPTVKLTTNLNKNDIDSIMKVQDDKYVGYWEYLDMSIKSKYTKLGGKYKLALLRDSLGYKIIYISGSKVNCKNWKPGMVKGRLYNTIFQDSYNLEWYDSQMKLMNEDTYVQIKENIIMELHFPLQDAIIRLFKKNRPQNILQPIQ